MLKITKKFNLVTIVLVILFLECVFSKLGFQQPDFLPGTPNRFHKIRAKRTPIPQGGFSPFIPRVPTTTNTRITTTAKPLAVKTTTTATTTGVRNPQSNKKQRSSPRLNWSKSASNQSLLSSNCDFQGKSNQLGPIKFEECINRCEGDTECSHFTWAPLRNGTCWSRSGSVDVGKAFHRKAPGLRCGFVLGPGSGIQWKDRNWAFNCDFYDSNFATDKTTSEECENLCAGTESCTHYSWTYASRGNGICGLKTGNVSKDDAFIIDEKNTLCGIVEDSAKLSGEPSWHMIIGGKNADDLASIEAYNWKTKERCFLTDLPLGLRIHSGTVLQDVPIVCGGFSYDVPQPTCYKYNKASDSWTTAAELLMAAASGSASILVPRKGWYIFGGEGISVTRSQKLISKDGQWEFGPDFYNSKFSTGECLVQLNDTTTVFIGGSVDNQGIVLLDWVSMTFSKAKERLVNKRWRSACALMKNSNDDPLVAVAGGIHRDGKGLEIWSPTDQTVKLVSKLLPTETEKSLGLNHASLVPIEGGTELLLYGGYQGEYQSDIWKYIEKSSTWVKEGVLQLAREEQVVLAVEDVQCKPLDENRSLF